MLQESPPSAKKKQQSKKQQSIVILILRIIKQSTQMLRLHQHRIQIGIRQL